LNGKKILVTVAIVLALLAAAAGGMLIFLNQHVVIDFRFYSKNAQQLDLREKEVSVTHYQQLQEALPQCRILWNVPFQGNLVSSDVKELTVTSLSHEDVEAIVYFTDLQTLKARDCKNYDHLLTLRNAYPQLQMEYLLPINGEVYDQDTTEMKITAITGQELALLPCLTKLETVTVSGGENLENIAQLQSYCQEKGLEFQVALGDQVLNATMDSVRAEAITEGELQLLQFMPQLKSLHLVSPEASAESVFALRSGRPDLNMTWEYIIWGVPVTMEDKEVDLSEGQVTTLEDVEKGLAYFPEVTNVFLGEPGFDNEEIAAYRERRRADYKVVWVVDLSGKMKVRTDIDNFMPSRDGWGYVRDHEIDNIRYCEDIICMDIGHMGVKDVSFLETLVNLEYLILAHTEVQYVDPIVNCKKLKFLELDWSCIRDVSPLVELTALEDLNLGMVWPDLTPIYEMKWLKNLYLINGNTKGNWPELLPNTRVVTRGTATVASGWRNLPNYYKMRDILGMYYMSAGY